MKPHKKKIIQVAGAALVAAGQSAFANNGDQMVGFSGLSNAMGGAVTATPQDVTTALSNPASLTFLNLGEQKTRFDMNVGLLNPNRELNGVKSDNGVYVLATGGLAFQSDRFGERLTVAVGAYPVSGGGVDFPREAFQMGPTNISVVASRQSLRIGPAFAYRVTDDFSLGLNLSLASNTMSLKGPNGNFPADVAYGWAAVVGATWRITPAMLLGAAYTTQTHSQDLQWNTDQGRYSLSFEDPQTFALGLSLRPSEKWLVEADVKYLDFKSVRDHILLDAPGALPDTTLAMGWDSQWVFALGTKYRMSQGSRILAGYNYGKSPIDESDVRANIGVTAIVEHHLSLGGEFDVSKHSTLSLSLIHGFKNEMSAPPAPMQPRADVAFETNLLTLQFTYRH